MISPEKNPNFQSLILESEKFTGSEVAILLPKNYRDMGMKVGDTFSSQGEEYTIKAIRSYL
ncbi:MAG: hypothetical protein V4492_08990 [Chlamydiota bacterium]